MLAVEFANEFFRLCAANKIIKSHPKTKKTPLTCIDPVIPPNRESIIGGQIRVSIIPSGVGRWDSERQEDSDSGGGVGVLAN